MTTRRTRLESRIAELLRVCVRWLRAGYKSNRLSGETVNYRCRDNERIVSVTEITLHEFRTEPEIYTQKPAPGSPLYSPTSPGAVDFIPESPNLKLESGGGCCGNSSDGERLPPTPLYSPSSPPSTQ